MTKKRVKCIVSGVPQTTEAGNDVLERLVRASAAAENMAIVSETLAVPYVPGEWTICLDLEAGSVIAVLNALTLAVEAFDGLSVESIHLIPAPTPAA